MRKNLFLFLLFLLVLVCAAPSSAKGNQLNYRLKWLFNASVAGDIYADAKGYFSDTGLEVNVKEGSPEKNAINELEMPPLAIVTIGSTSSTTF